MWISLEQRQENVSGNSLTQLYCGYTHTIFGDPDILSHTHVHAGCLSHTHTHRESQGPGVCSAHD